MPYKYMKPLEHITRGSGKNIDQIFRDFLTIAACTLAQQTREDLYLETINPYTKPDLSNFAKAFAHLINEMQANPFTDILGDAYEQMGSPKAKQMSGEFYTPNPVCKMMAQILIPTLPETRPVTIHEPCTGSGRMILATAEALFNKGLNYWELYVEAWDTSKQALMMTFINTTLWSIPCLTIHGNTLSLEHYDIWPNMWFRPLPKKEATQEEQVKSEEKEDSKATPTLNREEANINLGQGHEQTSLFDLSD